MANPPTEQYFVGIDVGTGSARAGVFDFQGNLQGAATAPIKMWKPAPDVVEQSSEDIWQRCGEVVRTALQKANVRAEQVGGIGFDATCSLVALRPDGRPITVSPTGADEQNIIVWMDHRAVEQTDRINTSKHEVLRYVGGAISPEMETPKLLWLKERAPETWRATGHFFDLPDFLTYRATGDPSRSLCSLVCKWTYLGHQTKGNDEAGWSDSYFSKNGLSDLVEDGYRRIGTHVRPMGEPVGQGLTIEAANDLGLLPGTAVGASIIDAHAGGLGVLGAVEPGQKLDPALLNTRVAMIAGTSSCFMAVSEEPRFIAGVWGPYFSAMIPGLWLTEGGQSATGAMLDHIIYNHAAYARAKQEAEAARISVFDYLNGLLSQMQRQRGYQHPAELTHDFHVYPDFHGNRSPRANPSLRGMVSGYTLSAQLEDLALQYLAAIQAIAYQTRHIVDEMNAKGYRISQIFACGGGLKNDVFLREHADISGCDLVLPREPEAVLLGAAILGAVASHAYPNILEGMKAMCRAGRKIIPSREVFEDYHTRKYRVYHQMYADQLNYHTMMQGGK